MSEDQMHDVLDALSDITNELRTLRGVLYDSGKASAEVIQQLKTEVIELGRIIHAK